MIFKHSSIPGVIIVTPEKHADSRGFFMETFKQKDFTDSGIFEHFIQDNKSFSKRRGTLRGLHFQKEPFEQDKLVSVNQGSIYDVAVDIRPDSPYYKKYIGIKLSAQNLRQLYIPRGFAHGFVTLEDRTEVFYKVTNPYSRDKEIGIRWDDPDLDINWPIRNPYLSEKDKNSPTFKELEKK